MRDDGDGREEREKKRSTWCAKRVSGAWCLRKPEHPGDCSSRHAQAQMMDLVIAGKSYSKLHASVFGAFGPRLPKHVLEAYEARQRAEDRAKLAELQKLGALGELRKMTDDEHRQALAMLTDLEERRADPGQIFDVLKMRAIEDEPDTSTPNGGIVDVLIHAVEWIRRKLKR